MTLAQRYANLKRRIGGNREVFGFEDSFGMPLEEQLHISMPAPHLRRILGELDFAIRLSAKNGGAFDPLLGSAFDSLEAAMDAEGTLTKSVCLNAEKTLGPMRESSKEYKLILAGHAHIDMNWMWGWNETVAATLATFSTVLGLMDEYPDFCFSQSQASVYEIVEQNDPDMMQRIKARIAEGRWEITASSWVEPDKNLPDTNSLIRQIGYTKEYLRDVWGVDPASLEIDFSPDAFGHSANIPEIDALGGVKYMYHCRGIDERLPLYRWRSRSGAELLVYHEQYWYNSSNIPRIGAGLIDIAEKQAGLKTGLIVYGVGDHGGGPTRRDIERAREMMEWPIFPEIRFGTFREFYKLAESVRELLPIRTGELGFNHTGCCTTQSRIKKYVRHSESALSDAMALSALAYGKTGASYDPAYLAEAWKKTLFCDFHDILTGSCTQDSREYAIGVLQQSLASAQTRATQAMRAVSDAVDTSSIAVKASAHYPLSYGQSEGAGAGFHADRAGVWPSRETGNGLTRVYTLFNPTAAGRAELVELTVWDWTGDLRFMKVTDAEGKPLEFQLLDTEYQKYWDHRYHRVLVYARMEPLSYATVVVTEDEMSEYPFYHNLYKNHPPFEPFVLENENIRASFDLSSGRMTSLISVKTGEEFIRPGASAGFCLVDTESRTSDAWRIGRYLTERDVTGTIELKKTVSGPLRNGFEFTAKIDESTIKAQISLDKGAEFVTVDAEIDWHGVGSQTVPVLIWKLPLAEKYEKFAYDVPGGAVERAPMELDVPGLSYAVALREKRPNFVPGSELLRTLSTAVGADRPAGCSHELSPGIIADCKSGFRGRTNGELVVSLINSSTSPDPYPERGIHRFRLGVGAFDPCKRHMHELSAAFKSPVMYCGCGVHAGTLPASGSLWRSEIKHCVIRSIEPINGGLRIIAGALGGKPGELDLSFESPVASAVFADVLGEPDKSKPAPMINGAEIRAVVRPFGTQIIDIKF